MRGLCSCSDETLQVGNGQIDLVVFWKDNVSMWQKLAIEAIPSR